MRLLSLSEAVSRLVDSGVMAKDKKQKEQGLKRLLQNNVILGVKPPSNQPKIGWKVDEDSLEGNIQIGLMSKIQMMKELLEARRELKTLQAASTELLTKREMSVGLILEEPSESPKMDALRTSETTPEPIEEEKSDENTKLVISKLKILGGAGPGRYDVSIVVNSELLIGTILDGTEENPTIQFEELHNKENDHHYVFGRTEEESEFLERVSFETHKNFKRKIVAFNKKKEMTQNE